ncbi:20S cyclosome subunit (BimA/Nuc2/Cdc27) [Penicillium capsulatum]|uniref:1-acyl-sn-glycerol-3-phosphate acyltransferase n=1 Tax=Penicillium capsulatum TaxID=69766 RepID=A0A9W9LQY7_9EURO|nr:20S cyclosome subunit (BimA/Nuc2/Cdc27) [Penicillium capsulatum]KAJ6136452.1 20S cyclosome subunit (BimA/Nuc2/Cdc27) [Penicillium capsulatum]
MSASPANVASQMRHLIYYHLDNNLVRNALFVAGRLYAHEPRNFESQYLLALCHLFNGDVKTAFECSQAGGLRGLHVGCSYVYAQACLDLGKYLDGVTALERSKPLWVAKNHWNKHNETQRRHVPDAAAVLCLMGKLCQAQKDLNKAVDCYVESLKLNPFMWDAFLGLTATGVNIKVPNIFQVTPELFSVLFRSDDEDLDSEHFSPAEGAFPAQMTGTTGSDPFTMPSSRGEPDTNYGGSALWETMHGKDFRIASGPSDTDSTWEPPMAPTRRGRTIQAFSLDGSGQPSPRMRPTGIRPRTKPRTESEEPSVGQPEREPPPAPRMADRKRTVSGQVAHPLPSQPTEPGAPQRRSVRLFNQIKPTTSKLSNGTLTGKDGREVKKVRAPNFKTRTGTQPTVGRVVSGNRKHVESTDSEERETRVPPGPFDHPGPPMSKASERTKVIEGLDWLLALFAKLASGYFALSRYKCSEAVQNFNSLSQGQRETPWVLSQLGRAYFEQAMYADAAKYFSRVQNLSPSRVEDMEIYSTVLWHLKSDVELAYLAHQLLEVDRLSPQAWCAIGNSFSHQRDHDQALKCFKRATMLDPDFAYAFTLQGHEYAATEEYEKALDAYRLGIKADARHYNAWYGLGTVYDKLGKLDEAEQHFRNAAMINPTNAVLICCIGLILERSDNPKQALAHYERACSLAPNSVLARFRKARVLMRLKEYTISLAELKILKDMAPDEANVHFLLGKLYKMLHDRANAIKHFTTALNLDPKAAQFIKDAMESLVSEEVEDEDMSLRPIMSITSYILSGISSFVVVTLSLFALGQKVPRAAFVARCLAAYGSLLLCATYGVLASIVLRLTGYGRVSQWATARSFKWVMRFTTGVTFDIVEGEEYLTTRPAVFIGNHQTELDVLMLGTIFPPYCSVTAKKSLRNVPFLGWFMALSRTVFIDRANRETAMKAFDGAVDEMRVHRQSVFIFPEGTRSYSDDPMLLPFKKGAFHLAIKAGVPIVPVVTENYAHVMSPRHRRFDAGAIKVKVLPPIITKDLTSADVDQLTVSTRESMLKTITDMAHKQENKEFPRANGVSTGVEI